MITLKIVRISKKIQSSSDLLQYTARYWAELIEEIEYEGYQVDSADRHKPAQWITAYKDGNEYEIEVNKYSDGTYEIVKADIVGSVCRSTKTKVTASWDEDDPEWIKLNRKHVLDSDGFYTDYTLYTNGHEYICMFGDEDIYGPDPDYADFSTDSEEEAMEWFDSYEGMDETDEIYSSQQPHDIMQTIINAIHGDKNSIDYLRSNGYRVYVLHNPLQPQEVVTYEVVDPYGKIYNYDNTSSYYSQVRGTSEWADDLEHPDQEYDSAATSINSNKLPAIYKMVNFEPGKVYLDFGGGKFDNGVYFVKDKGATLLVYDPYNRSDEHNKKVLAELKENGGADAGLNSNVLNVIKEPEARLAVLRNLKRMVKPGGDIYITVYEGTGKGNEGPTKAGYQLNRKTADYLEEIQQVFPNAARKGKLIKATNASSSVYGKQVYCTSIFASDTDIDAEDLRGLSREQIEQILDEAPVGTKVLHIRNLKNRFNMDAHIEKKSAYQANYYQGMGTPLDFKDQDTFWEVGAYKDPYIDDTIYKAVNGTDKYYGLTSEVLKAHGITASAHLGDDNHSNLTICPYCHGDRFNDKIGLCLDCGYDEKSWGTGPYYDQEYEDDLDDYDHNYEPDQADWNDLKDVTSASYGGAYDILDDYYFTRDDLVDFGEEVVAQLENLEPGDYFVNDLDMLNPKTIHIEVYCRNKETYSDKNIVIDMRRIQKPSGLNKYAYQVASDMYDEFSKYDEVNSSSDYQIMKRSYKNSRKFRSQGDAEYLNFIDELDHKGVAHDQYDNLKDDGCTVFYDDPKTPVVSSSGNGRMFIELTPFVKAWEAMNMDDSDLRRLESLILSNPEGGDIIQGSGGARKIRFQAQGKGKRGGARVIYVDFFRSERVYLITAYPKSEKSNLSPREIGIIKDIITDLE